MKVGQVFNLCVKGWVIILWWPPMYPWEHKLEFDNFIQLPQYPYCKLFGISKNLYHNFEFFLAQNEKGYSWVCGNVFDPC